MRAHLRDQSPRRRCRCGSAYGALHGTRFHSFAAQPPSCACLFDEHDFVAGLGGFERRRHAGNAAADDQNAPIACRLSALPAGTFIFFSFGAAHAHVVVGHLLPDLVVLAARRDGPDHAFAQVGARHRDVGEMERLGLRAARAGADHHVRDGFLLDVVADRLHALAAAQERVLAHERHLAFAAARSSPAARCRARSPMPQPEQMYAAVFISAMSVPPPPWQPWCTTLIARSAAAVALCTAAVDVAAGCVARRRRRTAGRRRPSLR